MNQPWVTTIGWRVNARRSARSGRSSPAGWGRWADIRAPAAERVFRCALRRLRVG
jgi:hypothetical protein